MRPSCHPTRRPCALLRGLASGAPSLPARRLSYGCRRGLDARAAPLSQQPATAPTAATTTTASSWPRPPPCTPTHRTIATAATAATAPTRTPTDKPLLILAIETSCDDTCVAVLSRSPSGTAARLLFNERVTSDNRDYRGVHPMHATMSHTRSLAPLVREALRALPLAPDEAAAEEGPGDRSRSTIRASPGPRRDQQDGIIWVDGRARRKPDLVAVTRGPGMPTSLATGLNTAKGLAVAWDVPLLGVNHMQAHALTPRLVSALEAGRREDEAAAAAAAAAAAGQGEERQTSREDAAVGAGEAASLEAAQQQQEQHSPAFPFLTLLVSGGHTMLVHSRGLTDHAILASTAADIAIGVMLDKSARDIIPPAELASLDTVSYGPALERFAFPPPPPPSPAEQPGREQDYDYGYTPPAKRADEIRPYDSGRGWSLTPPLSASTAMRYDFSGLRSQVQRVAATSPDMPLADRRLLARHAMRLAFEHLVSRVLFALRDQRDEARQRAKASLLLASSSSPDNSESTTETTTTKPHHLGQPPYPGEPTTLVLSGGVASNAYLRHVARSALGARGFPAVRVVAPPASLCTDNAAMVAWCAPEMWDAGWRSDMGRLAALRRWAVDPASPPGADEEAEPGGGILGAEGWFNIHSTP